MTMPHETKTAKDLPAGAEVTGRHTVWVKGRPGHVECWTASTGGHLSDGTIDRLLSEGASITRVPTGTHVKEQTA
ncbi:hypothetical protein ACGFIW_01490 [Micromonospora sp. NPDC048935]|uniref:hypothetical protein n=1 Tax=Micromonospora sp. NPDC048935 TaxID=3364262 RepID=UPI003716043B